MEGAMTNEAFVEWLQGDNTLSKEVNFYKWLVAM